MPSGTKRLQSTPNYVANSDLETYFTVAVPNTQKDQKSSLVGCHVTPSHTFQLYHSATFQPGR